MTIPPFPDDAVSALAAWRAAHPEATMADIEHEVDRQLSATRAALISDLAARVPSGARPVCSTCGTPMERHGRGSRTLRTAHEGEVTVTGPTYRCPACGAGVFPPQ